MVDWPLIGGLFWYSEVGHGGCGPPSPLFAIPNVAADPSTANAPPLHSGGLSYEIKHY